MQISGTLLMISTPLPYSIRKLHRTEKNENEREETETNGHSEESGNGWLIVFVAGKQTEVPFIV